MGPGTLSGAFPRGYKPPQQTPEQLRSQCVWRRKATLADLELWDQTLQEAQQGWITGPFHSESAHLGTSQWLCARRFPIVQGDKVRIIDDCLQSGVDSAYTTLNKLRLMDADHFISLVLCIIKAASHHRSTVALGAGVTRHKGWGEGLGLLGKTLDLASAYKQLGCRPETSFNRVLVAWDPLAKSSRYFVATALMFGATSAVYSFNRCSASLHHLAVSLGSVCCTFYFDDCPCVEPKATAGSADVFLIGLLEVLGWKVALQPKKNLPFGETFAMLGVQMDLSNTDSGTLSMRNKPERCRSQEGFDADLGPRLPCSIRVRVAPLQAELCAGAAAWLPFETGVFFLVKGVGLRVEQLASG